MRVLKIAETFRPILPRSKGLRNPYTQITPYGSVRKIEPIVSPFQSKSMLIYLLNLKQKRTVNKKAYYSCAPKIFNLYLLTYIKEQ